MRRQEIGEMQLCLFIRLRDLYQDLLWELYRIRYQDIYGSSIAFVNHSLDHSLSTRLISFDPSLSTQLIPRRGMVSP